MASQHFARDSDHLGKGGCLIIAVIRGRTFSQGHPLLLPNAPTILLRGFMVQFHTVCKTSLSCFS